MNSAAASALSPEIDFPDVPREVRALLSLWAEVFRLAVQEAKGGNARVDSASARKVVQSRAIAWISSGAKGPGSFLWLCAVFDLDPGRVRARVLPEPKARLKRKRG